MIYPSCRPLFFAGFWNTPVDYCGRVVANKCQLINVLCGLPWISLDMGVGGYALRQPASRPTYGCISLLLGRGLLHERPWQLLHASHLLGSSRFLLLAPAVARAQDFGVAESAETIDRGTFQFRRRTPKLPFGGDNLDNDIGINLMAGFGFTNSFDVEGGVAFYDGVTLFGLNADNGR